MGGNLITTTKESMLHLIDSVDGMRDHFGLLPLDGSNTSAEMQESSQSGLIAAAASISHVLIGSAEAHMRMFAESTEITQYTSVRAMLEPCALAKWLLDPGVNGGERAGRVFAYRYKGQEEMRKCHSAAGMAEAELATRDNISKMAAEAHDIGYQTLYRNGRIDGIHKRVPPTTHLIREALGKEEEKAYRILSAIAHGHTWAIFSIAVRLELTSSTVEVHDNPIALNWIATVATRAYCKAVWTFGTDRGWPKRDLVGRFEKSCNSLKIPDTDRPWS